MNAEPFDQCTALGRRVYKEFEFYDARRRVQLAGCMKVLRNLDASQQIILPASAGVKRTVRARGSGIGSSFGGGA